MGVVVVVDAELLLPLSPVMLLRRWPAVVVVVAVRVLPAERAEYLPALADRALGRGVGVGVVVDGSVLGDDDDDNPVAGRIPGRAGAVVSAPACSLPPESLRSTLLLLASPLSSPAPTQAPLFCACGSPCFPSLPSPSATSVQLFACWLPAGSTSMFRPGSDEPGAPSASDEGSPPSTALPSSDNPADATSAEPSTSGGSISPSPSPSSSSPPMPSLGSDLMAESSFLCSTLKRSARLSPLVGLSRPSDPASVAAGDRGWMVGLAGTLTDPRPARPGQVEQSMTAATGWGAGIVVSGAGSMSASGALSAAPPAASPQAPPALLPAAAFTADFDSVTHKHRQ